MMEQENCRLLEITKVLVVVNIFFQFIFLCSTTVTAVFFQRDHKEISPLFS